MNHPAPPEAHQTFADRFPELASAWRKIGEAGRNGPCDERTARLIKLGVAVGAKHEGAVHANVRKALALGISREEIEQVLALAAGTLGMPDVVATYTWARDELEDSKS